MQQGILVEPHYIELRPTNHLRCLNFCKFKLLHLTGIMRLMVTGPLRSTVAGGSAGIHPKTIITTSNGKDKATGWPARKDWALFQVTPAPAGPHVSPSTATLFITDLTTCVNRSCFIHPPQNALSEPKLRLTPPPPPAPALTHTSAQNRLGKDDFRCTTSAVR